VLVPRFLVELRVRLRMLLLQRALWQRELVTGLFRALVVLRVSNRLPKVDNSKLLRADNNRLLQHSKPPRDSKLRHPLCKPPKDSKTQLRHKPQHSKLLRLLSKANKLPAL
jgi:hypothetical protein